MHQLHRQWQLVQLRYFRHGRSFNGATGGGVDALSKEDLVAYLVNKGMDGDMATVNDCTNKVARAKAKAMMVKIKRGTVEIPQAGAAPPMPEIK